MSTNNDTLFYFQFGISLVGIGVVSSLLFISNENQNIFLPIFTSIIFAWIPSPLSKDNKTDKKVQPLEIEQARLNIQNRALNSV
jgi:hypothetical protein